WVLNEPESLPLLGKALDAGVNFFDTANVYSAGVSEQLLGKFLRGAAKREDVVVATKGFYPNGSPPNLTGLTRENIFGSIDASLQRLGLDYVDIYQVHRWDEKTPIDETMQALADIVKAGKARFAGASNMRTWHLAKAQLAAQKIGFRGYATMQNHYNLLYREDERDLIPFCEDQGIGLMCWSPLARGRLGRAGQPADTSRGVDDEVANTLYGLPTDPILDRVTAIAAKHKVSSAQVALAWIMAKGIVPIAGVTKGRHIDDAVAAAALNLSAQDIAQLEEAYTARGLAELPWSSKSIKDPREAENEQKP
ncbi:MAG: aldo/keto reductase, partial [Rhodospirillaceae bacterium]|nr:aldo/keto reductase [Rhodospirillaceae bacterium]